jgi:hypothetical protein
VSAPGQLAAARVSPAPFIMLHVAQPRALLGCAGRQSGPHGAASRQAVQVRLPR